LHFLLAAHVQNCPLWEEFGHEKTENLCAEQSNRSLMAARGTKRSDVRAPNE
jgi:hypothetical protein